MARSRGRLLVAIAQEPEPVHAQLLGPGQLPFLHSSFGMHSVIVTERQQIGVGAYAPSRW